MFSLIRRMFGVKAHSRPTSGEPISKRKIANTSPAKRPLSIDSKKKEHDELLLTKQKNPIQIYQELDDVITTKKSMKLTLKEKIDLPENQNFQFFSDLSDQAQELTQDLLLHFKERSYIHPNMDLQEPKYINRQIRTQNPLSTKSQFIKVQYSRRPCKLPRKPFKREASAKKIKKIDRICALCKKPITDQSSLKLACIHRFHEQCTVKMRERNRWQCGICESRNKKQGSIMNLGKKAKGVFSLRGSSIGS